MIIGAQPSVQAMLVRTEGIASIGIDRLIAHKGDALRKVYPLLDSEVCKACPVRVFEECQQMLPNGKPRAPAPGVAAGLTESTQPIETRP